MKITIKEQKKNALLDRAEVSGDIVFEDKTPSNSEVAQEIAKITGKKVELVVVKNIYTKFGHQEATFSAMVYNNLEMRNKNEMMTKHLRKKQEEAKKAEEAKKQEEQKAAAEEKKVEEAKPEEKVEEKKVEEVKAEEKEEAATKEEVKEEKEEPTEKETVESEQ